MALSILSLIIGSLFTWAVSKWYYNRSKDDFALLISKIDKLVVNSQSGEMKTKQSEISFRNKKFKDVLVNIDNIGDAMLAFAKTSGKDIGIGESGAPIFVLDQLIDRLERIKQTIQSYRDWRVHIGA